MSSCSTAVVHTGDAQELLADDALIHKFLGVHSGEEPETAPTPKAKAASKKGSTSVNGKNRA